MQLLTILYNSIQTKIDEMDSISRAFCPHIKNAINMFTAIFVFDVIPDIL